MQWKQFNWPHKRTDEHEFFFSLASILCLCMWTTFAINIVQWPSCARLFVTCLCNFNVFAPCIWLHVIAMQFGVHERLQTLAKRTNCASNCFAHRNVTATEGATRNTTSSLLAQVQLAPNNDNNDTCLPSSHKTHLL